MVSELRELRTETAVACAAANDRDGVLNASVQLVLGVVLGVFVGNALLARVLT